MPSGIRTFRIVFNEWIERKEKLVEKDKMSPETVRPYVSYNTHYFTILGDLDIRAIRKKHLQLLYDGLPDHLNDQDQKNVFDCLHSFFNWAVKWGDLESIPQWPEMEEVTSRERTASPSRSNTRLCRESPRSTGTSSSF